MTAIPKITIVTPTFNSAQYLQDAIESIISQQYPALEYIIIDGGSTDGTLEIIKRYEHHLAYWISEPDNGMYDAVHKGFARSTGQIMAWLNSDDMYPPWALAAVADIFTTLPDIDWITSIRPLLWNKQGIATDCMALSGYSKRGFQKGEHLPGSSRFALEVIQQESTFWRRSLWEKAGAKLDTGLRYGGDFELWARFYQYSNLIGVRTPLGGFRLHGNQLSQQQRQAYHQEAATVMKHYNIRSHSPLSAFARRRLAPFLRHNRARIYAAKLGICHQTQVCVYNQHTATWKLMTIYI